VPADFSTYNKAIGEITAWPYGGDRGSGNGRQLLAEPESARPADGLYEVERQ